MKKDEGERGDLGPMERARRNDSLCVDRKSKGRKSGVAYGAHVESAMDLASSPFSLFPGDCCGSSDQFGGKRLIQDLITIHKVTVGF
jgi:hypothetical protein